MTLPALPFTIPEIALPFDIPALMHPPVAHFIIAIPVIVLLLEIVNLIVKKRALGVTTFFLLVLATVAAISAYYTGGIDGKAAWDLLSSDGQAAVKAHKLFGTYLMLASIIVLFFKLISAMVQRGLVKGIYLLVLIVFVAGILKQGKEGGELVYKHGANVQIVKIKDDALFDCQDDLSDYVAEEKEAEEEAKAAEEAKKSEVVKAVEAPKAEVITEAPAVTEAPATKSEATSTATPTTETPVVETEAAATEEVVVKKVTEALEAQPEIATH